MTSGPAHAPVLSPTTSTSPAERWFGAAFERLHPRLQALHRDGGRLSGRVVFTTGSGVSGWIGRRLMTRMGLRPGAPARMTVEIAHDADGLHWRRRFDDGPMLASVFRPIGRWPEGCWRERAGPLELDLDVDLADGGWRWRQRACRVMGLPLPRALWPRVEAGKRVVGAHYRFEVEIHLPLLGRVLAWGGDLDVAS